MIKKLNYLKQLNSPNLQLKKLSFSCKFEVIDISKYD